MITKPANQNRNNQNQNRPHLNCVPPPPRPHTCTHARPPPPLTHTLTHTGRAACADTAERRGEAHCTYCGGHQRHLAGPLRVANKSWNKVISCNPRRCSRQRPRFHSRGPLDMFSFPRLQGHLAAGHVRHTALSMAALVKCNVFIFNKSLLDEKGKCRKLCDNLQ